MSAVISTSRPEWLEKSLECFRANEPFHLQDDAHFGFTVADLASGLDLVSAAADKAHISAAQILTILGGLGLGAVGCWMVRAAILDPEPLSKTVLLVLGGTALIAGGGGAVLHALGNQFSVRSGPVFFELRPVP